jgi:hypothetical protein
MISASEIEEAAIETVKFWLPTYCAEMERRLSLRKGTLIAPQNYTNRNSFDTVEGEKTPKIVVICTGLGAGPLKHAAAYSAMWRVGVGVATGAKTERECNRNVKAYAAAIRSLMMHKPKTVREYGLTSLSEIYWSSEDYIDLPQIPNQHRLYKAAEIWFQFEINAVVARGPGSIGPDTPDLNPEDYEDFQEVIMNIDINE